MRSAGGYECGLMQRHALAESQYLRIRLLEALYNFLDGFREVWVLGEPGVRCLGILLKPTRESVGHDFIAQWGDVHGLGPGETGGGIDARELASITCSG